MHVQKTTPIGRPLTLRRLGIWGANSKRTRHPGSASFSQARLAEAVRQGSYQPLADASCLPRRQPTPSRLMVMAGMLAVRRLDHAASPGMS